MTFVKHMKNTAEQLVEFWFIFPRSGTSAGKVPHLCFTIVAGTMYKTLGEAVPYNLNFIHFHSC
jgi:hypothetical protein